jgi:hypothetical protein
VIRNRSQQPSFRPQVEVLEARVVPATTTPLSGNLLSQLPALLSSTGSTNANGQLNLANGQNLLTQAGQMNNANGSNSSGSTGRQHLIEPVVSSLGFGIGTLFFPVQSAVQQQTTANSNLTTDVAAITSDVDQGASSQTIAVAYAKASNAFTQVNTLESQVKTQARTDEVFIALNFFSHTLNRTDEGVAGLTAFLINKNAKTAASTFNTANTTANTAQPGGFPSVASAV